MKRGNNNNNKCPYDFIECALAYVRGAYAVSLIPFLLNAGAHWGGYNNRCCRRRCTSAIHPITCRGHRGGVAGFCGRRTNGDVLRQSGTYLQHRAVSKHLHACVSNKP